MLFFLIQRTKQKIWGVEGGLFFSFSILSRVRSSLVPVGLKPWSTTSQILQNLVSCPNSVWLQISVSGPLAPELALQNQTRDGQNLHQLLQLLLLSKQTGKTRKATLKKNTSTTTISTLNWEAILQIHPHIRC